MTTYTIIDADGDKIIVEGTETEARGRAARYSRQWDCDCHIEDSEGKIVATYSR